MTNRAMHKDKVRKKKSVSTLTKVSAIEDLGAALITGVWAVVSSGMEYIFAEIRKGVTLSKIQLR